MTLPHALCPSPGSISHAPFFAPGALGLISDQARQPASPLLQGWERDSGREGIQILQPQRGPTSQALWRGALPTWAQN